MEHKIKVRNHLEVLLEEEVEDLIDLGQGHYASLVNAELRQNYGHHINLYGAVGYPIVK
jgi:hypothetical protein